MKLQDAYVAEQAAMGDWNKIGYTMRNGDSFDYSDNGQYANGNTNLVETLTTAKEGWRATSKVKLNDCVNTSTWKISVQQASGNAEGMVKYLTNISAQNCADLTPSFGKLATVSTDASVGGN